jgi:hypothetical protein
MASSDFGETGEAAYLSQFHFPKTVHEETDPRPDGTDHVSQDFLSNGGNRHFGWRGLPNSAMDKRSLAKRLSPKLKR